MRTTLKTILSTLLLFGTSVLAAPPNDDFSKAIPIAGTAITTKGSNVGATIEPDERNSWNNFIPVGTSVWWSWRAPSTQPVTIDTRGSSFDTALAVFTGDSLLNLDLVKHNDDCGDNGQTSSVTFDATVGTLYQIGVYGWNGTSGDINLNLHVWPQNAFPPPENDNFNRAFGISAMPADIQGSNAGATHEPGENYDGHGSGATVWWSFVAPSDGVLQLAELSSSFPLLMTLYQGSSVTSLVPLMNNYQNVGGSVSDYLFKKIQSDVSAGGRYFIAVDGFRGAQGTFHLRASFTPAPNNDAFGSSVQISDGTLHVSGSNIGASLELNEEHNGNFGQSGRSVWWSWTPNQSGPVSLTTVGSTFDTVLDVWTGSSLGALSLVTNNDDEFSFPGSTNDAASRVTFDAVAGTTYRIAVTGAGFTPASGAISLNFVKVALTDSTPIRRSVRPDSSVEFITKLHLSNLRSTATGPLRVRLVARAGYGSIGYLGLDQSFLDSLNAPDERLGSFGIRSPGNLAGATEVNVEVSGICPPPLLAGKWGLGRHVMAVLEEKVGGAWVAQDSRPILLGVWPEIAGQIGPAGGVIVISSGVPGATQNPCYLQVNFGPPEAINLGGAWRVSPTNYGEYKELHYYTNFTDRSLELDVQSTRFSIEVKDVPGFVTPTNRVLTLVPGQTTILDLFYALPSFAVTLTSSPPNGGTLSGGGSYVEGGTASLTAAANVGFQFLNWTENGAVVSTSPNYTLVVDRNRDVTANFGRLFYVPEAANYNGLFYESNLVAHQSSGFLKMTTTKSGTFTAQFNLAGSSYRLSGKVQTNGTVAKSVSRQGKSSLSVQLDLADPDRLVGQISDGTWTSQLSADRAGFPAQWDPKLGIHVT